MIKNVTTLTPGDFEVFPIWEHDILSGGTDLVKAIEWWPVTNLSLRVVGVRGIGANAEGLWLAITGIDCENAFKNEHLMSASIWSGKGWIHLPRYHDAHFSDDCYDKVATQLGRARKDVFPIRFSLAGLVESSDQKILNQTIEVIPTERRLGQQEIMQLCLS